MSCLWLLQKYDVFPQFVLVISRIVWCVILMGASTWMCYNVYERVAYYISNPKTVDQEYKYLEEIPFPAVTICNKNIAR